MRSAMIGILIILCIIGSADAFSLGISKPYMEDDTIMANTGEVLGIKFEVQRSNASSEPDSASLIINAGSPMLIDNSRVYNKTVNFAGSNKIPVYVEFKSLQPGLYEIDYFLKEGSSSSGGGISFAMGYRGEFFINVGNNLTFINSSNKNTTTNPPPPPPGDGGGSSGGGSSTGSSGNSGSGGIIPPRVNLTRPNSTRTDPPRQEIVDEGPSIVNNTEPKKIAEIVPIARNDAIKRINSTSENTDKEKITPEAKNLLMTVLISGFISILGVWGVVFYYYKTEFGEVP